MRLESGMPLQACFELLVPQPMAYFEGCGTFRMLGLVGLSGVSL